MSHISLSGLRVAYGVQEVLQDITVDIPDGQISVIIGPSGCGKTTLLKSLNRLVDLNEEIRVTGEVRIDGEDIYAAKTDVLALRTKVGFLSQKPYPLPMSIYDNVAFGPRIHRFSDDRIRDQIAGLAGHFPPATPRSPGAGRAVPSGKKEKMDTLVEGYLRLAGLWEEVRDRVHGPATHLSIGQQQRLSLARALAVGPEVILADEPTSALDPVSAQLVEKQFRILRDRYTLILVTHILRQARRIADYVLFMYMGELVEHGPAEQVFQSPRDGRTRAYLAGEFS
jgi:phosphate transport system ATP-binding protein